MNIGSCVPACLQEGCISLSTISGAGRRPYSLFPNGVDDVEDPRLVLDQGRHCSLLGWLERTKKGLCGL
jgi:hypothetical protein